MWVSKGKGYNHTCSAKFNAKPKSHEVQFAPQYSRVICLLSQSLLKFQSHWQLRSSISTAYNLKHSTASKTN